MKVKRSSWHCKIINFGSYFENKHDNLCNYFWRAVLKIAVLVYLITLFTMLGYHFFTSPQLIPNTIMVIFLISIVIVPIISIHYIRKIKGEPVKLSCENILYEFLKAKKRKVCPLIEYID